MPHASRRVELQEAVGARLSINQDINMRSYRRRLSELKHRGERMTHSSCVGDEPSKPASRARQPAITHSSPFLSLYQPLYYTLVAINVVKRAEARVVWLARLRCTFAI